MTIKSRSLEQILALLDTAKLDESGCLNWQGSLQPDGYGRICWKLPNGSTVWGAHRIAYWVKVGPIPAGLVIDHLCRNPRCVNTEHLEVVTVRENTMRGVNFVPLNAAKTHCLHGHPFDEENTRLVWRRGGRQERHCRECSRLAGARYYENRKRAAADR